MPDLYNSHERSDVDSKMNSAQNLCEECDKTLLHNGCIII